METIKKTPNFHQNAYVSAEISDLESLGWDFLSDHESVAQSQEISLEEAIRYNHTHYHVNIKVNEDGRTGWYFQQNAEFGNEVSDIEPTGDDEQTIKDLYQLHSEDKLWHIYEGQ